MMLKILAQIGGSSLFSQAWNGDSVRVFPSKRFVWPVSFTLEMKSTMTSFMISVPFFFTCHKGQTVKVSAGRRVMQIMTARADNLDNEPSTWLTFSASTLLSWKDHTMAEALSTGV